MGALGYASALVVLICFVLTEVRIFRDKQKAGTLHGVLGIVTCGLWAYIWGWVQSKRYHNVVIMLLWTVAYVMYVVFGGITVVRGLLGYPT